MSTRYGDASSSGSAGWEPPRPRPEIVPRFTMQKIDDAMNYLDENGYVVIRDVITEEEREHGIGLAWNFLECLQHGGHLPIDRHNPKSWDTPYWPDPVKVGIVNGDGVGQSEFLWFCRGINNVQQIFRRVWKEDELITSFDGFCIHRPFEYNVAFKTSGRSWYHVDQNGCKKPEKMCVQGLLNFFNAGETDGGLVVVPRSHKIFIEIFYKNEAQFAKMGDFVPIKDKSIWEGEIKRQGLVPIKVCCGPGDFILWDSRTIHCNSPATIDRPLPRDGTLLPPRRLVAYICMTPAKRLTKEAHASRILAYQSGDTTSHWPEDVYISPSRKGTMPGYVPIELSAGQLALIPLS